MITCVDKDYNEIAKKILEKATSNETLDGVRAKWADGSAATALSTFCTVTRYDLSKGLPILSLRKTNWKGAVKELLWIWVKNSNNVNDLDMKIWDAWADEKGSIGKAYGYQLGKKIQFPEGYMSQVERIIHLIKTEPANRRIMATLLNMDDMKDMALTPCAHTVTLMVDNGKLNLHLEQRSGDFLAASGPGGFNEIQYSVLCYMLAHVTGYEPGEFVHTVVNHHIYGRHVDYVREVANNYVDSKNLDDLPKFIINRDVKDFFDFKIEDFSVINYDPVMKSERFDIAE